MGGALLPALVVTPSGADWFSGWPANGPNSDWIAGDPNSTSPDARYSFYTTFDLTGYDLGSVSITGGSFSAYNTGSVILNGITILNTPTYQSATAITLPAGYYAFLPGMNTLEVDVAGSNNEGMRMEATLQATPSDNAPVALNFVPVQPCRVIDTRVTAPFIAGGATLTVNVPDSPCNIPSNAAAYSFNVTVVPHQPLGYLSVWPAGQTQPVVSTLNSDDGRVKANAAIVPAGQNGGVNFFATNDTDLVLDIDGYFVAASTGSGLEFYTVAPCRVVDTRNSNGELGGPSISGSEVRDLPVLQSNCGLPSGAQAYSFNFTAVPENVGLGYLSTWPAGQTQPLVSTLNAPTGTVTANAAIVPAGSNGDIEVFATNNTNLVVDTNGYFASAGGTGGLHFYAVPPCRLIDTRTQGSGQAFLGNHFVQVAGVCGIPAAPAIVVNATVVPSNALGYLTLWPYGSSQPTVSTLNASDGFVTSNMAIVPMAFGGIVSFASNNTQLVVDVTGYFAP